MKTTISSRRHGFLTRVSIFLIAVALTIGMVGCVPPPIQIRDWHDLHDIRNNLRDSYVLMNDLDATTAGYRELASPTANGGQGWQPIGTSDDRFTGSLDGQGYEIRDLFINRPDENYVGLFANISWTRHIDNVGVIENVGVVNADVTGDSNVGGLVGHNGGIVNNSYSSGSVTGTERVGGLVGWNQAALNNSFSSCTVAGDSHVGGLVGDNWYHGGIVSNSYSTGDVRGSTRVGGLVGYNWGIVNNSYSSGSATGAERVGGLVGYNKDTVSNSFWDRMTSGLGWSDGGTGKTTAEMQDIATFTDTAREGLDQPWDIAAVAHGETDPTCVWNIVPGQTYPFLSWQSVS
ncbi:MAG: GLUG motif-containing protein [Dehalococcoidia bacterium]